MNDLARYNLDKDVVLHLRGLKDVFYIKSVLGNEYSDEDYNNIIGELQQFIKLVEQCKKSKEV